MIRGDLSLECFGIVSPAGFSPPLPDAVTSPDPYDLLPYGGQARGGTHCRRLEAVARLFGVPAAPPSCARILDLGCGLGESLLAQALEYPGARFVACDSGAVHIARVTARIESLGLTNVQAWHRDVRDADADWGLFDYIICEGVFSWVGADVRRSILRVLRDSLAPHGVAYVSFNALPGWHLRRVVRDLMRFHAAQFTDPHEAVAQARAVLAATAEWTPADDAFAALIRDEYVIASHASDSYLLHEMLTEHNEPLYVRDFIAQCDDAGLRYLGDASIAPMFTWDLPVAAREFLSAMPLLLRQQYLDLLRGTPFRRCLLCHSEVEPDHQPAPSVLKPFFVGLHRHAQAVLKDEEDAGTATASDDHLVIGRCTLPSPGAVAGPALRALHRWRPEFVAVQDLLDMVPGPADHDAGDALLRFLLDAVTAGALDIALSPPRLASQPGEWPVVSRLARMQAATGTGVTSLKHEPVELSDVQRLIAQLADGTNNRQTLGEAVRHSLASGQVALGPFDHADDDTPDQVVKRALEFFGRAGLLCAPPGS
jgi:SAM-dependent methyltransferase